MKKYFKKDREKNLCQKSITPVFFIKFNLEEKKSFIIVGGNAEIFIHIWIH